MHIPHLVGAVVDPVTPCTETTKESSTVTPDEIIAHRRRRLLALANELDNVAGACRQMGVRRTTKKQVHISRPHLLGCCAHATDDRAPGAARHVRPGCERIPARHAQPGSIVRSRRREEKVPVAHVYAARLDVRDRTTRLPASVESVAEVIGTFVREITPAGPPHPGQRATLPAQSLAAETECAGGRFVVHAVASRQPLDKPTDRALVSMRCAPLYGRVLQRRARSIVARGWANASDRQRELSL